VGWSATSTARTKSSSAQNAVVWEIYEPEVWSRVMSHIGPGSRVLDVGAHFGLYAMAFGHRVGPGGCVLAAEPDPQNLAVLRKHITLNGIAVRRPRRARRLVRRTRPSKPQHEQPATPARQTRAQWPSRCSTLDAEAGEGQWDLLLIDVEGHEEKVLRGGDDSLSDPARRPSTIVIEVHPYARQTWEAHQPVC